jgi:FKBP-type peptidyl-prolyl cis-trans isomerase 2
MIEVDYIGTFDNGTEFDSSYKSGQPFSLILGSGGAIPGFDKALHCMEVGETKKFTLSPEDAYGEFDPAKIVSMPIEFIPAGENATIGDRVTLFDGGQLFQATIQDMNVTNVTFDLNSPLAGKALTFEVTVRNITPLALEEGSNDTEKKE